MKQETLSPKNGCQFTLYYWQTNRLNDFPFGSAAEGGWSRSGGETGKPLLSAYVRNPRPNVQHSSI